MLLPGLQWQRDKEHMAFLNKLLHRRPPKAAGNLGRNEPCWCGSGKKYKRCHYEADRKYFAQALRTACNGPT